MFIMALVGVFFGPSSWKLVSRWTIVTRFRIIVTRFWLHRRNKWINPQNGRGAQQVKTAQVNPDHLRGNFSWALPWTPSRVVSWKLSWGVFEGLRTGKSTLVGTLVGAFVGALVGPLVDPLVGQISLSPALCVAHKSNDKLPENI